MQVAYAYKSMTYEIAYWTAFETMALCKLHILKNQGLTEMRLNRRAK